MKMLYHDGFVGNNSEGNSLLDNDYIDDRRIHYYNGIKTNNYHDQNNTVAENYEIMDSQNTIHNPYLQINGNVHNNSLYPIGVGCLIPEDVRPPPNPYIASYESAFPESTGLIGSPFFHPPPEPMMLSPFNPMMGYFHNAIDENQPNPFNLPNFMIPVDRSDSTKMMTAVIENKFRNELNAFASELASSISMIEMLNPKCLPNIHSISAQKNRNNSYIDDDLDLHDRIMKMNIETQSQENCNSNVIHDYEPVCSIGAPELACVDLDNGNNTEGKNSNLSNEVNKKDTNHLAKLLERVNIRDNNSRVKKVIASKIDTNIDKIKNQNKIPAEKANFSNKHNFLKAKRSLTKIDDTKSSHLKKVLDVNVANPANSILKVNEKIDRMNSHATKYKAEGNKNRIPLRNKDTVGLMDKSRTRLNSKRIQLQSS